MSCLFDLRDPDVAEYDGAAVAEEGDVALAAQDALVFGVGLGR